MTTTPTTQFNAAFPNPALTVDYDKVLYFVQLSFKRFPHGKLKSWAAEHGFNYQTLISLRNNTLRRPAPLQVQKVMEKLLDKFKTDLIRVTRSGVNTHEFVFQDVEAIDLFHQHLKEYETPAPSNNPAATAGE